MTRKINLRLPLAAGALALAAGAAQADQVIIDDLIVDGSICAGFDCVNGEAFGFDTLRLKENNLRIKFQDTSTSASFPSRDWQITANDSSNGGANKFSIDDIDGGRTPFTIEAGAPSHSLYVDDGGRLGFGTNTPVVDLHVKSGNTPTLRLEQDGSSGFTPQTWDLAGNETNFFIRDATAGSTLPFRVFPGAPSNALTIEGSTGDIGMGTTNPTGALDVEGTGVMLIDLNSTDSNAVQLRLISAGADGVRRIVASDSGGTPDSQMIFNQDSIVLAGANDGANTLATLDLNGIELPAGRAFSVNGTDLNVPDYVFAPDYELMPLSDLQAFVAKNSHLPNVPSAADIQGSALNMTEMQLTLLQKVEELTLYTLQQQAKIDKQRSEIEVLKTLATQ